MKRSSSFVLPTPTPAPLHSSHLTSLHLPDQPSHLPSTKQIYINTQTSHKQKHTIFHSPYKAGRKNPNYTNPTFMSSDIFYPPEYSFPTSHSKSKPKLGLLQTRNDVVREEQFKSRTLNKSMSGVCLNRTVGKEKEGGKVKGLLLDLEKLTKVQKEISREKRRGRQRGQDAWLDGSYSRVNSKVHRKHEEARQIQQQLQMFRKSPSQANHLRSLDNQNPIYFENRWSVMNKELRKEGYKRELIDEMGKAIRRKVEEKWLRDSEKENERKNVDREVKSYKEGVVKGVEYDKQKARLLGRLLGEQIMYRG